MHPRNVQAERPSVEGPRGPPASSRSLTPHSRQGQRQWAAPASETSPRGSPESSPSSIRKRCYLGSCQAESCPGTLAGRPPYSHPPAASWHRGVPSLCLLPQLGKGTARGVRPLNSARRSGRGSNATRPLAPQRRPPPAGLSRGPLKPPPRSVREASRPLASCPGSGSLSARGSDRQWTVGAGGQACLGCGSQEPR